MKECLNHLNENYDPIYISTDLNNDSIPILDMKNNFLELIPQFNKNDQIKSKKILNDLLFYDCFEKEKIKELKEIYKENENFRFSNFNLPIRLKCLLEIAYGLSVG